MDVNQTLSEGLKREYDISLTAAQIDERVDARIATLATEVNMPGFRPGKVPASVVKTRYGKQVLGEVLQTALDEATRSIIEGNDLRVATNPSLDITEYEDGGDMKATIRIEIMPEIKPIDLTKLEISRPSVEVSKTEVDNAVKAIAEENRPTKPIEKPRAVQNGDTVLIDFVGRINGEAFEGGTAEGHRLAIGSNTFIPGFEEGLLGAMPGTTVNVDISFPGEYPAEHLAGKASVFEVKIHEIHEPGEIKVDDDFATTMGMENLDALKAAVREQIMRQHSTAIRTKVKTSLLDALDKVVGEFDIPPTLIEQEYSSICHAMNPHEHHDDDHEHSCDDGLSAEDKAEADTMAHRRVRLGLALTDIGRQNDLKVTDEEKNRAITAEAQRYPGQEQQVLEYFQKNPEAAQQLAGPLFEDKVVDYILEIAKVNDNVMTVEELYKADEDVTKPATKKTAKKAAKKSSAKSTPKKAAKKASAKKTN
jgi:trigger factor